MDIAGKCNICKDHDDELTHLNLYVNGSEGIWICLRCRIALTDTAKYMQSLSGRVADITRREA
jgi:ribosomal protein L37AE/L43A